MKRIIFASCLSLLAAVSVARSDFFVGCNYWASHAGVYMWRNWNPQQVERDLDRFQEHGMTVLRVFPLWPDFQPLTAEYGGGGSFRGFTQAGGPLQNAAGVDAEMMRRFRFLCDAAEKRGIKLVVGLVTGWMSGRLFVPPGLGGKNVITDPQALMWETRFVRHFVRETKDHPAIRAWDLGNECNCMGGASQAEAWNWMNAIASAIRLEDAKRPVVSGMHSCSTRATDAWSLRMQGELMDVTTTHPYPLWTPDCHREDFNTLRDSLHAAAESALYRDLSGKPCFPEEAGSMGPTITREERAAAAMRVMLFTSWAEGLPGFLWWCGFDQTHLGFAPYDWTAIERELGLFRTDGTPKPTVTAMKAFAGFLEKLPFDRLPAKRYDAVVLLSSREGAWRQAFGAYLLAAQAGFAVRFADAERALPEASFYILPSGNGYEAFTRGAWHRVLDRVRAGATLLMTMGNGTAFADLREAAGVEIDTHYRKPSEAAFAFAEWPARTIRVSDSHVKRFFAREARVLAADTDGHPVLTENALGEGKVLFFNYAIEERSVANGGCWTGANLNPLYLVYRTAARRAGVRTAVVKPAEASDLILSEHPCGDRTYVVAVNAGQQELVCDLKVDGEVREIHGAGTFVSGRLTIPSNDGCVLVVAGGRMWYNSGMKKVDGVYVKDTLANAGKYADYGAHFAKAVAFLQRKDLMKLPNGRYELDGDNAYAMVQEATLKPWGTGRPELHHRYFDIQLPLSGEETIGVGKFDPATSGSFDEGKDCGFYDETPVEPLTLRPGEFAILHPETCAHAPCCTVDGPGNVRKIVIKVRK